MPTKFKSWVSAARLRTLPLSLSGIITGTAIAKIYGYYDTAIFVAALLTTVAFQITSNFANDYGDGVKGTDNEERIGPQRALQSGALSAQELKRGIWVAIVISLVLVVLTILLAFGWQAWPRLLVFFFLGGLSIWAAIRYTVGEQAYGYRGLGDLFVFLFFGLLAVCGTTYLYTKTFVAISLLPALTMGALSVGVLNLNNLRDHVSDKKSGKNTMVVRMGYGKGKQFHVLLILLALLGMVLFGYMNVACSTYWHLLVFLPILWQLRRVWLQEEPVKLDPELKVLALSTFALALAFYMDYHYFCIFVE